MKITYRDEELWNTWTHGLGILLGVVGAIFMAVRIQGMDGLSRTSVWVYSISVIVLFSASTVYHAVADPRVKRKLRILDHISIYLLIAGTYTPVALITLREGSGCGFLVRSGAWHYSELYSSCFLQGGLRSFLCCLRGSQWAQYPYHHRRHRLLRVFFWHHRLHLLQCQSPFRL